MYVASKLGKTVITQKDLTEERILMKSAREAVMEWKSKRNYIRDALQAGASVEPGARSVQLRTCRPLVIR
jgi:hypothetical protein